MTCLWTEAVVVGVALVVLGNVIGFAISKTRLSVNLPKNCKSWNKNYVMEITLFLTGFLGHILFEYTGVNKWYCKNGVACRK